jgi:PKD repeat protein
MESIKPTLTILVLVILVSSSLTGQINLAKYNELTPQQLQLLDQELSNYQVYEAEFGFTAIKSAESLKSHQSLVSLSLEDQEYTFPLRQNLKLSNELSRQYVCLGGTVSGTNYNLTLSKNHLSGQLTTGSKTTFLTPLSNFIKGASSNLIVKYSEDALRQDQSEHVGCRHTIEQKITQEINSRSNPQTCTVARYCIANAYDMLTKYGSEQAVINHNVSILNAVQTLYRSEFNVNIELYLVGIHVAKSPNEEPFSENATSEDANQLLTAFRSWAGNSFGGSRPAGIGGGFGVDFDYASVWTSRDIKQATSNTIGLAYRPGYYNVLEDYSSSTARLSVLMAHELGHNFGALHDSQGTKAIMSSSLLLTPDWSASSVATISNTLASADYLMDCSDMGPPVANFTSSHPRVCVGTAVTFEDQSQYGATRNWNFGNGNPSSSTLAKPTVNFNTPGTYVVTLTSSNSSGSDINSQVIIVEETPKINCSPSGNASGGLAYFEFENVTTSTQYGEDAGVYEDFLCEQIIRVNESTVYNPIVEIAGIRDISFFLDMNGNGIFESGEHLGGFRIPAEGRYRIPLTAPTNIIRNAIIRLRVITSSDAIEDACTVPTIGQVEDYGLYYASQVASGCTDPNALNYDPNAIEDDGSCVYESLTVWYQDNDGDGFGNNLDNITSADQPVGYVDNNLDCNDNDNNIHPLSDEICDAVDNNCNMEVDEDLLETTYYMDSDGDGFGNPGVSITSCSPPAGYVTNSLDCNDTESTAFRDALEICDGLDNNCDGLIDNVADAFIFYRDADNDGYGNPAQSIEACEIPPGYALSADDCDDNNAFVNPASEEICDNLDNDCDGQIDNGIAASLTYYRDADNDGYGNANETIDACEQPLGYVTSTGDCDDNNPNVNPQSIELCDNIDNNCDGAIDNGAQIITYYRDNDNDGYGNSDQSIDACEQPLGYTTQAGDCDDNNANVNPQSIELCDNIDNNCDGDIDNGAQTTTYYRDNDNDGYGNSVQSIDACEQPLGYTTQAGDCDDNNAAVYPNNIESCDGIDNDCNGQVDDNITVSSYYLDADNDGYGDEGTTTTACSKPEGYVLQSGDCDDNDASIHPDAEDICDGIDNNCNGAFDEDGDFSTFYKDADGDGYGDPNISISLCIQPNGFVRQGGDCNDNNPDINPDQVEICDGLDNNCNGAIDEDTCAEYYGRVWSDNGNFIEDSDEPGINGIQMRLIRTGKSSSNYEVTTDAAGYYQLSGVSDGDYILEVGYRSIKGNYIFNSNSQDFTIDRDLKIARLENVSVENQELELPVVTFLEENTISGSITWQNNGLPASDYTVALISMDQLNEVTQETVTDSEGDYTFNSIKPGTYHLEFYSDTIYDFAIKQDFGIDTEVVSSYRVENKNIGQSSVITLTTGESIEEINAQLIESSGVLSIDEDIHLELIVNGDNSANLLWNKHSHSAWEYIIEVAKNQTAEYQPHSSCLDCSAHQLNQNQAGLYYYRIKARSTQQDAYKYSNVVSQTVINGATTSLKVHPNPAQDFIYLESADQVIGLNIFNQNGEKILSVDNPKLIKQKLDISQINNGVYLIQIKTIDQNSTTKLIINR